MLLVPIRRKQKNLARCRLYAVLLRAEVALYLPIDYVSRNRNTVGDQAVPLVGAYRGDIVVQFVEEDGHTLDPVTKIWRQIRKI